MHGLNALSVRTIPEGFILANTGELVAIPKAGPGPMTYIVLAAAGWWLWSRYKAGKAA
jgi:hypothetical protein